MDAFDFDDLDDLPHFFLLDAESVVDDEEEEAASSSNFPAFLVTVVPDGESRGLAGGREEEEEGELSGLMVNEFELA